MTKKVYLNCTYFAGGDDVQQLCEAGEAEFLEIMDLVGMASKPMHVRRLQKALQEWVHNPGEFLKHMPKDNFNPNQIFISLFQKMILIIKIF